MVFGTRSKVKRAKNAVVTVEGTPLKIVPTYKYLGVILDSTLTYNCQVSSTLSLVAYKTNLLAKILKFMSEKVALQIYKSKIIPFTKAAEQVFRICKSVNVRFDTDELHRSTRMPKLQARHTAHINNFMYKRLGKADLRDNREIRTRAHDAPLFRTYIPKNEAYKRSMIYSGSHQWNNLPAAVRNIKNFAEFKTKQKQAMLS